MPESTFGMNRYMYVDGNPVKFRDDSGHNKHIHIFNQITRHMSGGAEWASGGLQRAAVTHSKVTGQDYEKRSRVDYAKTGATGLLLGSAFGAIALYTDIGFIGADAYIVEISGSAILGGILYTSVYEYGVRGGFDNWGLTNNARGAISNTAVLLGVSSGLFRAMTSP